MELGLLLLPAALEAYYTLYGERLGRRARILVGVLTPLLLVAIGASNGWVGGLETGFMLIAFFAAGVVAAARLNEWRYLGLVAVLLLFLAMSGYRLYRLDPRGGVFLEALLPVSMLLAGLGLGLYSSRGRSAPRVIVGLASLVACVALGYWALVSTRLHAPLLGEPLDALLWLLALSPLVCGEGCVPAAIASGALAAGIVAGYPPYVEPIGHGLEQFTIALVTLAVLVYAARREGIQLEARLAPSVILSLAALLAGFSGGALLEYNTAGGLLASGLTVAALTHVLIERQRSTILSHLLLVAAGLVLLASLLTSGVVNLECSVEPVALAGNAPSPKPDPLVVHSYYPLYWGVVNETSVYAWLASTEGRRAALEFVRFAHAIRLAAEKRGISLRGLNLSLPYPETLPRLVARLVCINASIVLEPSIALLPSRLPLNSTPVETPLGVLQPLELRLEEGAAKRLAIDYLVMVSDPRRTGRNAIRYALYTALLVSWGEYRALNDTARLLFYHALNPNATVEPVRATLVAYTAPYSRLAALLSPILVAAGYAARLAAHARKEHVLTKLV